MQFPKKKWMNKTRNSVNLMKKLDNVFSKYIRLRDADKNGVCRCITCGGFFPWNRGDAGHFVSRDKKAVRYDVRNVNFQCPYCNRFRSGEQYIYGEAIDKKYGEGTAKELMNLSKMAYTKLDENYFLVMIEEYKGKVKELKKTKNILQTSK
jgi:hypothetical protein